MSIWEIDPMHSEVRFEVNHLLTSRVTGSFNEFDGIMKLNSKNFEKSEITFSAQISSLTTGNPERDKHLKSEALFNLEKFPELKFVSISFTRTEEKDSYILKGLLTIKDSTKEVELKVVFGGEVIDFYDNQKMGFDLYTKINRKDFGLLWNQYSDSNGLGVSDDVELTLNIQMLKTG